MKVENIQVLPTGAKNQKISDSDGSEFEQLFNQILDGEIGSGDSLDDVKQLFEQFSSERDNALDQQDTVPDEGESHLALLLSGQGLPIESLMTYGEKSDHLPTENGVSTEQVSQLSHTEGVEGVMDATDLIRTNPAHMLSQGQETIEGKDDILAYGTMAFKPLDQEGENTVPLESETFQKNLLGQDGQQISTVPESMIYSEETFENPPWYNDRVETTELERPTTENQPVQWSTDFAPKSEAHTSSGQDQAQSPFNVETEPGTTEVKDATRGDATSDTTGVEQKQVQSQLSVETKPSTAEDMDAIPEDTAYDTSEVHQQHGTSPLGKAVNTASDELLMKSFSDDSLSENIQRLNDSIVQLVETTSDGDTSVMKVKLHPEELGEVHLVLQMEEGKVLAKILVDSESVKQLFHNKVDLLQENLSKQNVHLDKVQIDVNDHGDSSPSQNPDSRPRQEKNDPVYTRDSRHIKVDVERLKSPYTEGSTLGTRQISILA